MKITRFGIGTVLLAMCAVSRTQSAQKTQTAISDKERFVGAWHLAAISGPDGKPAKDAPAGMLIYTGDGHMSVQLMYPKSAGAVSNEYVLGGYEASFGSYDINEATHTVTHHVEGANTRELLVGKDLPRIYEFRANGRLVIKPARRDEHWSVTWEHY